MAKDKKLYYSIYLKPLYIDICNYINQEIKNISNDNSLKSRTLNGLLKKFSRTILSVSVLEDSYLYFEGRSLLRSLCEMLFDIVYLESNPVEYYDRYYYFSQYEKYSKLKEKTDLTSENIQLIPNITQIKKDSDYFENNYTGKRSRWNGISVFDEVQELDKLFPNNYVSFEYIFKVIYKSETLFSHNSGIIIDGIYSDIPVEPESMINLDNINDIAIITSILITCLPDVFKNRLSTLKEIDEIVGKYKDILKV